LTPRLALSGESGPFYWGGKQRAAKHKFSPQNASVVEIEVSLQQARHE
jgi:hypothetical protein